MSKQQIEALIQKALSTLQLSFDIPPYQIEATKDKQHGDYACNIALQLSKKVGKKPRDIAEMIVSAIPSSDYIQKIEIAGPGFINFFLSSIALFLRFWIKETNTGNRILGKVSVLSLSLCQQIPMGRCMSAMVATQPMAQWFQICLQPWDLMCIVNIM
jgi:arginyl-tRNA synthetase